MSRIHLHGAHHGPGHDGLHDPGDHPGHGPKSHWPGRLELLITVLLGLAAVTGAYAALRNEQRNHDATQQFSDGISSVVQAGYQYTEGGQAFVRDENLFTQFATAVHDNKLDLARYIQNQLMSPELKAGVRWWESSANVNSGHPARSPFTSRDPAYHIAGFTSGDQYAVAYGRSFAHARTAQDKADHFTLIEVILATALFLYGIAGVTRNMTLKVGMLVAGASIFVISCVLLITG